MRRTKIIATIGPKIYQYSKLEILAKLGMNVARLNMSHGNHNWHKDIIKAVKTINSKGIYSVALMLDTKGPEIRTGDLKTDIVLKKGDEFTFTIKRQVQYPKNCTEINYDGFIEDVKVGDVILIDTGMLSFKVKKKTKTDVVCESMDEGLLSSRRHVHVKGKSMRLPSITKKDWEDIDFGISEGVDFIALSFTKDAKSVEKLKSYLEKKNAPIDVIAKIESKDALDNLDEIVKVSDGVMVARGDLGGEIPIEEVPLAQEKIVATSLKFKKPVIIATHLLESMIINPTPTRAEVADTALAVKQFSDAIMLSGETATGNHPFRSVEVFDAVAKRIEESLLGDNKFLSAGSSDSRQELARNACIMANNLKTDAIIVFTRRGLTAALVSHFRPNAPIFAFTDMPSVRRRLNLYWGVYPFRIEFSSDPEKTIQRAIEVLKVKELIKKENKIVIVSDILAGRELVETIQIRKIN